MQTKSLSAPPIDLERLLKLRLAVARFGEMDMAKWWNTKGQLGKMGTLALRRGFPRTHCFAQARSVFAVAAQRCADVFFPPNCVTLWHLPESMEDAFDARWESWIELFDKPNGLLPFFKQIETLPAAADLALVLRDLGLVNEQYLQAFAKLRRSAEGHAVPLPYAFSNSDEDIALLALGFAKGEPGALAVPYARLA